MVEKYRNLQDKLLNYRKKTGQMEENAKLQGIQDVWDPCITHPNPSNC